MPLQKHHKQEQEQEHCSSVLEGSYNPMQVVPVEIRIGLVRDCNLELVLVQVEHYNLEQVAHCNLGQEQVHCNLEQGSQHRLVLEVHCSLVQVLGQVHCN